MKFCTGTLYAALFFLSILGTSISGYSQNGEIKLRYLGTAGWEITDGKTVILVDPYISRLKLGNGPSVSSDDHRKNYSPSDFYESDYPLIDSIITRADYILVHHSHFDHLSDVPYIAKKTGAKVISTATSTRILRAYGIPNEQLYTVKGGEDYQFENFSVRIIPSIHSALRGKLYFDDRELPDDLKVPLRVNEFIEGGSLMFLLRLGSKKILTMGSMNFVERELMGVEADVILPGVNFSRNEIFKYTERLLKLTGYPETVIPAHWDNFRLPYGFSQEKAIKDKVMPFIEEVKLASPKSNVIIPSHLETIEIK